MPKKLLIIVPILLLLALVAIILKTKVFDQANFGALRISSTPKATVYIDGNQSGTTPLDDKKVKAGDHIIKLVVENVENGVWEGNVKVSPGVYTIVNRNISPVPSGETLTLEKTATKDKAALTLISVPDQAVIKLDGQPKGFAPLSLNDLTPGDYQISVSSTGYEEKSLSAHTVSGYKLLISIQLAATGNVPTPTPQAQRDPALLDTPSSSTPTPSSTTPTPKPTTASLDKPYVTIKDTPTGFLRVRATPGSDGTELAQVKPGQSFPYLDDTQNGWYKIQYVADKEGWVSGVYADLIQ